MDTRQKIVDLSEAAAKQFSAGEWTIAPGLFDPLTAAQAKRLNLLAESGRRLAAIVLNSERTLLPADARAALVAGLRAVDLVVVDDNDEWRAALRNSERVRILEDKQGEAARSAEFVQLVIRRQKSA